MGNGTVSRSWRWRPRVRSTSPSRRRSCAMRSRTRRRSTSSCVSPGPRVPTPPPRRDRWVHCRVRRGRRYWSCASSTCILPSRLRARCAKMSRMSALRSMTLHESAFSRLRCCAGESASSKTTTSPRVDSSRSWTSATFPAPMNVAGWMRRSCWIACPTTSRPAVSASRPSSSIDSSTGMRLFGRSTPTSTARSAPRAVLCRRVVNGTTACRSRPRARPPRPPRRTPPRGCSPARR